MRSADSDPRPNAGTARCGLMLALALVVAVTACTPDDSTRGGQGGGESGAGVAQAPGAPTGDRAGAPTGDGAADDGAPQRTATRPAAPVVTVSGVSSGAYMAVQVHVALADLVSGAGAIAGGPYHCARGSIRRALGPCMGGADLDGDAAITAARQAAAAGRIAALEHLRGDRVWLFHSPADSVVGAGAVAAADAFYRALLVGEGADDAAGVEGLLTVVDDVPAAHGWPTVDTGQPCQDMGGDFINACGYDAAGALLQHLLGPLSPPGNPAAGGALLALDLSALIPDGAGLAGTGHAYVPATCRDGAACRLHVSFHGCQQGAEFVEQRFVAGTGLNAWAATNDIVVLYPQVARQMTNPLGCWDWWGYTGADYDQRSGLQVQAVENMIRAFAASRLLP